MFIMRSRPVIRQLGALQLVPAVTELIIAELLYLQYKDRTKPIYLYINSTGTSRADGETVSTVTDAVNDTVQSSVPKVPAKIDVWCRLALKLKAQQYLTQCSTLPMRCADWHGLFDTVLCKGSLTGQSQLGRLDAVLLLLIVWDCASIFLRR